MMGSDNNNSWGETPLLSCLCDTGYLVVPNRKTTFFVFFDSAERLT
jgi:hypothetical protein